MLYTSLPPYQLSVEAYWDLVGIQQTQWKLSTDGQILVWLHERWMIPKPTQHLIQQEHWLVKEQAGIPDMKSKWYWLMKGRWELVSAFQQRQHVNLNLLWKNETGEIQVPVEHMVIWWNEHTQQICNQLSPEDQSRMKQACDLLPKASADRQNPAITSKHLRWEQRKHQRNQAREKALQEGLGLFLNFLDAHPTPDESWYYLKQILKELPFPWKQLRRVQQAQLWTLLSYLREVFCGLKPIHFPRSIKCLYDRFTAAWCKQYPSFRKEDLYILPPL